MAQAVRKKEHYFCEFLCPHCGEHNVYCKKIIPHYILCPNSGCRRPIQIKLSEDDLSATSSVQAKA